MILTYKKNSLKKKCSLRSPYISEHRKVSAMEIHIGNIEMANKKYLFPYDPVRLYSKWPVVQSLDGSQVLKYLKEIEEHI